MNKELKNIIKNLNGNVLGIGLDDNLSKLINDNDNILECTLLSNDAKKIKKERFKLFPKTFKINKLRKKFKKKRVDYIICNYDVINKYLNTFVKDSIYINKNKLYIYNVDFDIIKSKYSRYNTKILYKNKIAIIDNKDAKTSFIKDNYYRVIDFKDKLIEIIGNILMG